MLSRALSLATAMLLIGFAAPSSIVTTAQAQNLEAGKSPAQIFSANCTVCHKSARGLLKSVTPGDLPGFLRQHYTTSPDMAKSLSGYLAANGAGGGRSANDDGLTRRGRELSREQAPVSGADGAAEPAPRHGRKARRAAPAEATTAPAGEAPAAAEGEASAKPKAKGKKGNRLHPAPKSEAKPETDKTEPATQAAPAKPTEQTKPAEAAKPAEPPATRADPVPAVTPAPKEAAPAAPEPAPAKPDAQ